MVFTSADLPLSLLTPLSKTPSVVTPRPASPPFGMKPLVGCLPALLLVVKTVLSTRAAHGDDWLAAAASSAAAIDLVDVLRAAPTPVLTSVGPKYFARLYSTALAASGSAFDVVGVPVCLDVFVDRLFTYGDVSESCLLVALIYLDRLLASATNIILTSANVHKLFGVAFMLAVKWHEDDYYTPAFFARLIGLTTEEVNELERIFLSGFSYRLFVTNEQFSLAETAFMAEALDSAVGLSVFQRLRKHNVANIDEAAERARTWHIVPAGDVTWSARSSDFRPYAETAHSPFSLPHSNTAPLGYDVGNGMVDLTRLCSASALAAIARVQLEHDFPKVACSGMWQPLARGRVYSQRGLRRREVLLLLSQGVPMSTWLPPLEFRQIPHAYLSHVMPVDNHVGDLGDAYVGMPVDSFAAVPFEPASECRDRVVPTLCSSADYLQGVADGARASWVDTLKSVDWGYGAGGNNGGRFDVGTGYNVPVGGIYAPSIWTTR